MKTDLQMQPGVATDLTPKEAGKVFVWKNADKVRFVNGKPRTIGGWVSATNAVNGICRGLSDWLLLSGVAVSALGTHKGVQLWSGGSLHAIGPRRILVNPLANNPFSTTNGSPDVLVGHVAHGAIEGDTVIFSGATTVAGLTLNGSWIVTEVVDADSYKFTAAGNANATTSGGGAAVVADYWINIGTIDTASASGYGAGSYGSGSWNAPRSSTGLIDARTWSFATWGEDLIINPAGGSIYLWDASAGFTSPATIISQAPATAISIFMTDENRQLVAIGAHDGVNPDRMLVRWCDQEDYTTWTGTATNAAGRKRLDHGNFLVTMIPSSDGYLIFSDRAFWKMQFVGPPDTFSWSKAIEHGGIMGPNAGCSANGVPYWMGLENFYLYDGTLKILPCTVRKSVFENINTQQRVKVYAAFTVGFPEVWWFYPSANSSEVDRYVMVNTQDGSWSIGSMVRTAFKGDSKTNSTPYGVGSDGNLYYHETGITANGSPLNPVLESGDVRIADGDQNMFIADIIPDFVSITGAMQATITAKKYPNSTSPEEVHVKGPIILDAATRFKQVRVRGRQVSLKIESPDIADSWTLGTFNFDAIPDGKR